MSMIACDNGGNPIPKLDGGVYTAISKAIIDLGVQTSEKFGTTQRRFIMMWDVLNEEVEINGEKHQRTITKEYSFSLNEKSTLRKDLQAWRGQSFTDEELQGFNILNILNKPCQLQIILEEKNGKQSNLIASIMALPKGTNIEGLNNTYYIDLTDSATWNNWDKIPTWIQERIKKADNYESTGFKGYVESLETTNNESDTNVITDDDLPF